jgi:hypothetical protein
VDAAEVEQEVRDFLRKRIEEIQWLSWEELDAYGKRAETFTASTGESYRVLSKVYWDGDEWASGIEIEIRAYAAAGRRRWWPYRDHRVRGAATDPVPAPPPGWEPHRKRWLR